MKTQSSNGKIIVNSVIYSFSGLLLKCFSFFLLPLYTSYLTTEDYGVTSIASSFLTTSGFVVSCSLFSAVMRFYVDLKEDPQKLKRFYGTIVVFIFISSAVAAAFLFVFSDILTRYIFSGIDFFPIVFICVSSIAFHCQHLVYDNILRSQQRAAKVSVISIIYFLTGVALNILFVVGLKLGALGVILSTAITSVLYTAYFWGDMLRTKSIVFCLDLGLLKDALKYSIPIMPHNLSTQITVLISQVLIGNINNLGSLGVYSIAAQFGSIADTVQSYVNQAYGPWLYEKLHAKEDEYKVTIRSIANMLSIVIGLFLLGIALFAEDYIILFIEKSYVGACKYVPLVVLVYAIKTAYYFYINVLFYYKKAAKILFTATLTSSILNVLLSTLLIPAWGVYGSICADALGMFVRVLIVIWICKYFDDIGLHAWDFVKNFLIVAVYIVLGLLLSVFYFHNRFSWINFAYKISVVCAYLAMLAIIYGKQIKVIFESFLNKRGKTHRKS